MIVSPDVLHVLLDCNPESGLIFWKERTPDLFYGKVQCKDTSCKIWNSANAGKQAFITHKDGYLLGSIFKRKYQAHRVIWAMAHGSWPVGTIDHKNGIRSDNRLVNLRDVSVQVNNRNAHIRTDNTSGVCGVSWSNDRMKWRATISVSGKTISLGRFDLIDDAITARKIASEKFGFHKNHGREADPEMQKYEGMNE